MHQEVFTTDKKELFMPKILMLCRRDDRTDYDTAASMARGLQTVTADNTEYIAAEYEDLVFFFDGDDFHIYDGGGVDLRAYDAIFQFGWFKTKMLEDMALSVALYAEHYKIPHRNTEALHSRSTRKVSQYTAAALNKLQTIPFVFSGNSEKMLEWAQTQELPLIVKDSSGSRGSNNYLAESYEEVATILEDSSIPFLVQTFIENDGDYRLIVSENSVEMAILRKGGPDTHLNNTSKGGTGVVVSIEELDEAMKNDAVRISKVLRREFTGVDMVVDKKTGKYYFLEANNMPQISTGSNTTEKMRVLDAYLRALLAMKGSNDD